MRISEYVINHIKGDNKIKAALCIGFNKHFSSIDRWLKDNAENGPLTTAQALSIIKEKTGFSDEQILTTEPIAA